jgi:hypothetical protein
MSNNFSYPGYYAAGNNMEMTPFFGFGQHDDTLHQLKFEHKMIPMVLEKRREEQKISMLMMTNSWC